MGDDERDPFESVKFSPEAEYQDRFLTTGVKALYSSITTRLPPSRDRAIAITRLEECHMWLRKALRDA